MRDYHIDTPQAQEDDQWLHWVTLYTDAGWSPQHGGTWAFRVRHSFNPIRHEDYGYVEPHARDANSAEMAAIVFGAEWVLRTYDRVDGIGVRTDSKTAISVLKFGARRHRRADYRYWQERMARAMHKKSETQGHTCKLRLRWVRGHQVGDTTRIWLNNRCDELARKARNSS